MLSNYSLRNFTVVSFCIALWAFLFIAPYSMYHVISILPICLLPCLKFFVQKQYAIESVKQCAVFFLSWSIIFFASIANGVFPAPVNFILLLCSSVYLISSQDERRDIAELFLRGYTLVLAISLVEYFLYLAGFSLQLGTVVRPGVVVYQYIQLPFNLIQESTGGIGVTRFQSLVNEPGLVGTLNALLLYNIDRKAYMKEYIILILTGLFTASLAFYLLFTFYIITSLKSVKAIGASLVVVLLIYTLYVFNQDHPTVRYMQYRIELGEDADNRTSDQFENLYAQFKNSDSKWLGNGLDSVSQMKISDGGNDGVKKITFEVGYIGIFLLLLSYTYIICRNRQTFPKRIVFLIVFWMSFYQRAGILFPYYALVIAMPYLGERRLMVNRMSLKKNSMTTKIN